MSEQPQGTDISAADLDVEGHDELSATSDPASYQDDDTLDGTLGGLGGAEGTSGGSG